MLKKLGCMHFIVLGLFLFMCSNGYAFIRTKIEGIKLIQENDRTNIRFTFNQKPTTAPEILARGNILQFTLKNVIIWPRIEKQITLGGTNVQLLAYQYNNDEVRVRAIFPYRLPERFAQEITVGEVAKEMVITMGRDGTAPAQSERTQTSANVEKFDEKYLNKLSEKFSQNTDQKASSPASKIADSVKSFASSSERSASKFTLGKYILKFSAFLALVLLLFYGVVTLFKRGVMGKGRLGLLTTKDGVVVLSTTHLAPKKSLVLIKAHTQVFLLSNTDGGINLISEIKNVPTLIKNEEQETTGSNFDTTLNDSTQREQNFKIKDTQIEAANVAAATAEQEGLAKFLNEKPVRDEVKISEKIKSKVKSLRAFQ